MAQFDAVDALLATVRKEAELPPAEERRVLREALNLSRAQVARALEVSPSTVGGWESGRDPAGEVRDRYAYFLNGAQAKAAALTAENTPDTAAGEPRPGDRTETAAEHADATDQEFEADADDVEALPAPRPCVLCGQDARHQVAGYPQHLDSADCTTAVAAPAAAAPEPPDPAPTPAPASRPAALASKGRPGQTRTVKTVRAGGRVQTTDDAPDLIADAVSAALAEHHGDVEAATAALVKRAIPNAMILLDATRKGGRYDIVAHPWIPDILRKQSAKGADRIWEARPKWTRPELPFGRHEVTSLDINGAYLSALKTHLPIGQLEHSEGNVHDRRRAGVHLITPPAWEHHAVLPNPLGDRDEDGPLWVTEPTLRLLLRLSGPKYGSVAAHLDRFARVVFTATLFGPFARAEDARNALRAVRVGESDADIELLLDWHAQLYPQTDSAQAAATHLVPLRPDRFAEDFVASHLLRPRVPELLTELLVSCPATRDDANDGYMRRRAVALLNGAGERHPMIDELLQDVHGEVPELFAYINSKGFKYYPHRTEVVLRGGKPQTIYFFAKVPRNAKGQPARIPKTRVVKENPRNGFLTIATKKDLPGEGCEAERRSASESS